MFLFADWPPPNYDMPRTVLEPGDFSFLFDSLKITMSSVANVGFYILAICIVMGLVVSVFRMVLDRFNFLRSVDYRERQRNIKALDRERNMDSIVDDRVADMEISAKARKVYRERNPNADLEERIYQRQLSYDAAVELRKRKLVIARKR